MKKKMCGDCKMDLKKEEEDGEATEPTILSLQPGILSTLT